MRVDRLETAVGRYTAPNGLRILVETMPAVRSVALGVFVRAASAHERPDIMGVSHLLEHMVFKGTERRSAREIAVALEARGGTLDAYTSRDHTTYHAQVLREDLPLAVDVLTDLVRRPLLREADLALERNVVLEEIRGVEDTPDDLVFDLHAEALWPGHPYGFPILGTAETVGALRAEDLRVVHGRGYFPGNMVIAAAGQVDAETLLAALEREGWFDHAPAGETPEPLPMPAPPSAARHGYTRRVERDTQQTHLVMGTDTIPARDDRRYPLGIAINVLGGGMSSRLFQRVREELGLAYAVYAYQHFYASAGQCGIYVGTQPETADQALDVVRDELQRIARDGVRGDELQRARQQLKGQLVLSLESPASRMYRLAAVEMYQDRYRSLTDLLAEVDGVTEDRVAQVAAAFLAPDRQATVTLGPS